MPSRSQQFRILVFPFPGKVQIYAIWHILCSQAHVVILAEAWGNPVQWDARWYVMLALHRHDLEQLTKKVILLSGLKRALFPRSLCSVFVQDPVSSMTFVQMEHAFERAKEMTSLPGNISGRFSFPRGKSIYWSRLFRCYFDNIVVYDLANCHYTSYI